MQLLLRWIITAAALYATVYLGQTLGLKLSVDGAAPALLAVLVLAIVNAVLRPVAQLITLPLSCLTFGLFAFVVNALMFWLVGKLVPGFRVDGFLPALFGSVVMGLISGALNHLLISDRERHGRRKV